MANIRVLIGEKDGIEFGYPMEYTLKAIDVPFDCTASTLESEEVQSAICETVARANLGVGLPRFPITLIHNSNAGNGTWLSYSSFTPGVEIVLPKKCVLSEITFGNTYARSFSFTIRKNSKTSDILETFTATDLKYGVFVSQNNPLFSAGDVIFIQYLANGQTLYNLAVNLFFQAVE